MNKRITIFFILAVFGLTSTAQNQDDTNIPTTKGTPESFLFSVSTLTPADIKWSFDYSGSYGERVSGPFGFEGISQQLGIKGYLGNRFTLYANAALGFSGDNNVSSAQRAEVIRNFLGGKKAQGFRLGAGLGVGKDFSNVFSMLSRITLAYKSSRWKTGGNIIFEKAMASNRDAIDVITSLGLHYRLIGEFYGGLEAVGEDLEGFWDEEEAEGGAKLLAGPSFSLTPKKSRLSFSLSGGPVFYATRNQQVNPDAIRELPSQSGLMVRARVIFNLSEVL